MYVTGSLSRPLGPFALQSHEAWFDLQPFRHRPLPLDRPGLIVEKDGYRLNVPGQKAQLWHPGLAYKRIKLKEDILRKVIGIRPGDWVLDGTLGMGHDALALADAGANVIGVEINPALLLYTLCGIYRYNRALSQCIHGRRGDYRDILKSADSNSVDHVYLDPMFPVHSTRRQNGTWAVMRSVVEDRTRLELEDLSEAIRVARRTVTFKLAPGESMAALRQMKPYECIGSKRQSYAVWRLENECETAC